MKSHRERMDVIGNNISNVNTSGFKAGRATFADTLSQTQSGAARASGDLGGINPKQVGLGVSIETIDHPFTDAALMSTGKNTDLALEGNGFFVVEKNGEVFYTRSGAFEFDSDGNYVLPGSGYFVKGWRATDGTVDLTKESTAITIPSTTALKPKATETITYSNNLNAKVSLITSIGITDSKGASVTSGVSGPHHVGDAVGGTVSNVAVKFFNGVSLASTSSGYANGTNYGFPDMQVNVSNGTVIDLSTANGLTSYTAGAYPSGTVAALTVTTSLGTIEVDSSSSVGVVLDPSFTSASTDLDSLTITSGPVASGSDYIYTLSDGSLLTSSSSSYVVGATLDDPTASGTSASVVVTGVTGTMSDNSTFAGGYGTYAVGDVLPQYTIDDITGTITDSTGTVTLDSYAMTSGTVWPSIMSTTSRIVLTAGTDTIRVASTDTDTYSVGGTYSSTIGSMLVAVADGSTHYVTSPSVGYTVGHSVPLTTTVNVYDSLGKAHKVAILLEKTGTANQWQASLGTTTILEEDGTTTDLSMADTIIQFTEDGLISPTQPKGILNISYSAAEPQTVEIDFSNLFQYASENTVHAETDGYTSGTLASVSFDRSGSVTGVYTNGVKRIEAMIAIAQFSNPSGLTNVGGNMFQESNNSGKANIKFASAHNVQVASSSLEMSNVNIANEFSDMITTQKGFMANSKMITSSDELIDLLINMKR